MAQRGFIYISKEDDGNYLVEVTWPDSAFKSNYWAMHGKFDSNGVLKYDNCVKTVTVFYENGNETTDENGVQSPYIEYEGGKGSFTYKEGKLYWNDEEEQHRTIDILCDVAFLLCFRQSLTFFIPVPKSLFYLVT